MSAEDGARRPLWVELSFLAILIGVFLGLLALGVWQLQRLAWKTDLIEAVEARAFGEPVPPPAGDATKDEHVFLRVVAKGIYRHDRSRQIKAVTDLGPGFWLLTPLKTADGHVWINRGFVLPGSTPDEWSQPAGTVSVQGLLRITEPEGTLLESNDPTAGRWVSRDVLALSRDVGIEDPAAYFIDADHSGPASAWPRGGLTVTAYNNPHLVYAMTWFAMAGLLAVGLVFVVRDRLASGKP